MIEYPIESCKETMRLVRRKNYNMPQKYFKSQIITSGIINSVLNGLIALFSYRSKVNIPYKDASIDVLITVGIISFLVSWLSVTATRKEFAAGKLSKPDYRWLKLPKYAAFRALIITTVCVLIFGGLIVNGLIYLFSPVSINNWVYIGTKTLYTGVCASLATGLSILSEFGEG